jgi:LPXTG-motif cell wall-anchored protein
MKLLQRLKNVIVIAILLLGNLYLPSTAAIAETSDTPPPKDISSMIKVGSAALSRYKDGVWTVLEPGTTITKGDALQLDIRGIAINEGDMAQVESGDYFEIQLPKNIINFANKAETDITENGEVIAKWSITDGVLRFTLTDVGADKAYLENGYLFAQGRAETTGDNDVIITIGGEDINLGDYEVVPPVDDGTIWEMGDYHKTLYKYVYDQQAERPTWGFDINFIDTKALYETGNYTTKQNVVLVDELPDGVYFSNDDWMEIGSWLYAPMKKDGTSTGYSMSTRGLMSQVYKSKFAKIDQTDGETWIAFQDRVKSTPAPAYGIYGGNKIIWNFGNLQGDLFTYNQESLKDALAEFRTKNPSFTDEEEAFIMSLYGENGKLQGKATNLFIEFSTVVTNGNGTYHNSASLSYNGTDEVSDDVYLDYQYALAGIETGEPGSVLVKKVDESGSALSGIGFKLQKQSPESLLFEDYLPNGGEKFTSSTGELAFVGLTSGTYKIVETYRPMQYTDSPTYTITNADGSVTTDTDQFSIQLGSDAKGITINAINHNKTTQVKGQKMWVDGNNQDGLRPETITVQLLKNGVAYGEPKVVTEADGWEYAFSNLPEYDGDVKNVWTVQEEAVPGYDVTYDGMNITNTHVPEVVSIPVTKVWDDNDDQDGIRPDKIIVHLNAGTEGREVGLMTITKDMIGEDGNWHYTFENLPKYDQGKLIDYSVTEENVAGYDHEINGFVITNHRAPNKTSVSVTKFWDDEEDINSLRPDSVKVQLFANNRAKGEVVVLSDENNWSYTWSGLDEKLAGNVIRYTVKELDVPDGYTVSVDDSDIANIIMTNHHEPIEEPEEDTEEPKEPGDPEDPTTPSTPEEPEVPNKPEDPTTPPTPEEPEVPNKPEEPQTPGTPENPVTPQTPIPTPSTPVTPQAPKVTPAPVQPNTPVVKVAKPTKQIKLPNTGDKESIVSVTVGTALIVAAMVTFVLKKRAKKQYRHE